MSQSAGRPMMLAVLLREFGPPSVLAEQVPAPSAGAGQALVEVALANITFVETQFRATGLGPFRGQLPMIPGNGVGGTVVAVATGSTPARSGGRWCRAPVARAAMPSWPSWTPAG